MIKPENIIIEDEAFTGFILDENGNETTEIYYYKKYKVVDEDGNVLQSGEYGQYDNLYSILGIDVENCIDCGK
jgi:hypothetical protein